MNRFFIIIAVASLAFASMACGISVNIPVDRIVTGPTQERAIQVEAPDYEVVDLMISFGAGELRLDPAEDGSRYLVDGTAEFNVPDFEPKINVKNAEVSLSTGDLEITGVPSFKDKVKNKWDLKLGHQPMKLKINAGAYQGDLDLGGLALTSLDVTDGAADVRLRFGSPNRVEMDRLFYQTGASKVSLLRLADANFSTMTFRGGAGDYRLDFSGKLLRDAVVSIDSGVSQVVIIVPQGTSAMVVTQGGLLNVNASSEWDREGDSYFLTGEGPTLTINVDTGVGNLELRTR